MSSKLTEVTTARDSLAQAATCFESEKNICQTSTETYSKVVIESAKELGKLHQQIEQLEADIAEKDLEMVRHSDSDIVHSELLLVRFANRELFARCTLPSSAVHHPTTLLVPFPATCAEELMHSAL